MSNLPIKHVAQHIATQDNRMTRDPIFCVQEKLVIQGGNLEVLSGYSSDCPLHVHMQPKEHRMVVWIPVRFFFTQAEADRYVRIFPYNHTGDLRVYVASGWRNREWGSIRRHLQALHAASLPEDSPSGEATSGAEETQDSEPPTPPSQEHR